MATGPIAHYSCHLNTHSYHFSTREKKPQQQKCRYLGSIKSNVPSDVYSLQIFAEVESLLFTDKESLKPGPVSAVVFHSAFITKLVREIDRFELRTRRNTATLSC